MSDRPSEPVAVMQAAVTGTPADSAFRERGPGGAAMLTIAMLVVTAGAAYARMFRGGFPILQTGDDVRLGYEALLLHRHQVIYRDFFEFCQPGLVFLYRLWGEVFGFGVAQMNYAILSISVAVSYCVWRVAKQWAAPAWAAVATGCAYYWSLPPHPLYHACATALLVCVAAVAEPPRIKVASFARLATAGIIAGLAFLMMQSRGALGGLLLTVWLWRRWGRRSAGVFVIAAALPVAAVAIYFAAYGALRDWFHFTFLFAMGRTSLGTWSGLRAFASGFALPSAGIALRTLTQYALVISIPTAAAVALARREAPRGVRLLALLTLSQIVAVAYGPDIGRLLAGMIPGFVVICWRCSRARFERGLLWTAAALVAVLIARQTWRVQTAAYVAIADRTGGGAALLSSVEDPSRSEWILQHTASGEVVAFYPWENDLLFLGDLRNPSRFQWLDDGGFNSGDEIASVVAAIRRDRPKLAMWVHGLGQGQTAPHQLRPLYDYLYTCYVPVARFETGDVLQRRGGGDCAAKP